MGLDTQEMCNSMSCAVISSSVTDLSTVSFTASHVAVLGTFSLFLNLQLTFTDKCSDHLEAYLRYCCQTVEFAKFMDDLDVRCQAEYNGSLLYKYVHILVCIIL